MSEASLRRLGQRQGLVARVDVDLSSAAWPVGVKADAPLPGCPLDVYRSEGCAQFYRYTRPDPPSIADL